MKKYILPAALLASIISSCGGNKIEVKDGEVGITDALQAAKAIAEGASEANDRWAERKKKGDTIAIAYKDLETYLPEISGYTKDGGPKGNQTNMPGLGSWSQTEQSYTNGDKRIKISIADYNSSQMAFTSVTALYKLNISSEDDTKKEGSVDLGMKDVAGYETVYKERPEASLAVIAGDRFYINIESDGSNDIDQLKSIGKDIASALSSKF
ncbi:MAG: hypothetical protein JNK79_16970 [Chitinophagaceae bacterium]|nr:hypothetical protein [Chitinophagaceae bacterium]